MGDIMKQAFRLMLCGGAAGMINGLLGAGGGMVLVPLLCLLTDTKDEEIFPVSVCIVLPICIVSLAVTGFRNGGLPFGAALPYLIGGAIGGIAAGFTDGKIPVRWLHRGLGLVILWGGVRYLW